MLCRIPRYSLGIGVRRCPSTPLAVEFGRHLKQLPGGRVVLPIPSLSQFRIRQAHSASKQSAAAGSVEDIVSETQRALELSNRIRQTMAGIEEHDLIVSHYSVALIMH